MDDLQLWNLGFEKLEKLLAGFSGETGQRMKQLLTRYREIKEAFAEVVAEVDSASVCRECGGECCLNGKYRFNVLDALARIVALTVTTADFTQKPLCPYGSDTGCTMAPGLRPADCVIFICDAIDRSLSAPALKIAAAQEVALRECIAEASRMTGEQMRTPLLLWAAKQQIQL